MSILVFLICVLASTIGAICGIGGGVIIKPMLDLFYHADVATISFLSGCTVLSMSCYSVIKNLSSGDNLVDLKTGTSLALGGALGGIAGKQLFSAVRVMFSNPNMVGAVQSASLALLTVGTLIYTICKDRIRSRHIRSLAISAIIGIALGILSSFLGIGGGPFNLVILFYFFGMDTKTAAQNSLYIILLSQITSLLTTLTTRAVPAFEWSMLLLMALGGIGGGMLGRRFNKKLDNAAVEKMFIVLMIVIILISIYNTVRYAGISIR